MKTPVMDLDHAHSRGLSDFRTQLGLDQPAAETGPSLAKSQSVSDSTHENQPLRTGLARILHLGLHSCGADRSRVPFFRFSRAELPALFRDFGTLVAAIALGLWAHHSSQSSALEGWNRKHRPSTSAWRAAAAAKGYRAVRVQKPPRLPRVEWDVRPPLLWRTEDQHWMVLQSDLPHEATMIFHDGIRTQDPPTWRPLGQKWTDFQAFLNESLPPGHPKKQNTFAHDPRELFRSK